MFFEHALQSFQNFWRVTDEYSVMHVLRQIALLGASARIFNNYHMLQQLEVYYQRTPANLQSDCKINTAGEPAHTLNRDEFPLTSQHG